MFRSRIAAGLLAASAVIAASVLGAAPATAATLPTGATIDVIADDGGIYSVNPSTAVGSLVGTPTGINSFAAIDVNQSGQGYAIAQGEGTSFLYSANAVTGVLTELVEIKNGGDSMSGCQGIDLSAAGRLTVSCTFEVGESLVSLIGWVDPATGAFTGLTDISTEDDDIVRALASNAAGTLYYFTELGEVFILQPSGESTPVTSVAGRVLAADFDRTDQLWVTIGGDGEGPVGNSLGTLEIATGVLTEIAQYSSPGFEGFSSVSITVWGGYLSNTGTNALDFLPIAIGAVLLLLAGIAVAVTHRITHRRRHSSHPHS